MHIYVFSKNSIMRKKKKSRIEKETISCSYQSCIIKEEIRMSKKSYAGGLAKKTRRLLRKVIPNRRIKDALFRYLFKDKKSLLQLYNALNHSHYDNPDLLTIVTFENVIYMTIKEDLSFLIANTLNLYEHQSTENPNMPLRGLLYLADRYEEYIRQNNANIYGTKQVMLPSPRYVVLYNGSGMEEERKELRLSDAFRNKEETPALECIATVININMGHNKELLQQCRPLYEYSYFIDLIRNKEGEGYSYQDAFTNRR